MTNEGGFFSPKMKKWVKVKKRKPTEGNYDDVFAEETCSRPKKRTPRPPTPEGYWDVGMSPPTMRVARSEQG